MNVLFEQQVVQNAALGAEAIWHAVNETFDASQKLSGIHFPLAFIILPLVFHRRTAEQLSHRAQQGALYKAVTADREITVGLQKRMEAMSQNTFNAISVALDSGLLKIDNDHYRQLLPGRRSPPVQHITEEVKIVMSASKRVGHALHEMSPVQLSTQLNIRF